MKFSTLHTEGRHESMESTTPQGAPSALVYLDHNATTPVAASVAERVREWLGQWGNPSSIHQTGRGPKALLRTARDQVAAMLEVNPLEIVFTSGGSESNNLALKGVFDIFQNQNQNQFRNPTFRDRYLFSAVEHPSVKRTAEYLRDRGARVEFIPVSRDGAIGLAAYEAMMGDDVALVSVMLANNETGNVFPVKRLAEIAHAKGALFHSDCVQALGKLPLNLRDLGIDLATFSGHKFYALKGAGVLYVRRGVNIESLIHGGGQERHRRGGTENVLAIASLGAMCELRDQVGPRATELERERDRMEQRLLAEIPGLHLTGAGSPRLPNTSSMVIEGVDGETLLMNLDLRGYAVSTGAACSSGSPEPSPVLLAMGLTRAEAQSSLRVGLGWETESSDIDGFIETLKDVVTRLRSIT